MNKLKIQIYSDIHLELINKIPKIKPLADYLILAGDIGKSNNNLLKQFLEYCSQNWKKVFYILGNHEYYIKNSNYTKILNSYEELTNKFSNIYCLENKSIELDENIDIYGSTLWTSSVNDSGFNDYNFIDRDVVNAISKKGMCNLKKYLNESNKKSIIVTHFPPTQNNTSDPVYKNQPQHIKNYFSHKDILQEVKKDNIICWISGHTHYSYDFKENNVRCISNQFGYKEELVNGLTKLNIDGVYELDV